MCICISIYISKVWFYKMCAPRDIWLHDPYKNYMQNTYVDKISGAQDKTTLHELSCVVIDQYK